LFDRDAKNGIEFKAQLIAAKQAKRDESQVIAKRFVKNIQPISVGV